MFGQGSVENQIAQLEAKLAAKKGELMGAESQKPEKQILSEMIRAQGPATETASSNPTPAVPVATAPATRNLTDEEKSKLNTFIEDAFKDGINSAIKEAQAYGDAFFVDKLHDRLVDEYYDKLVQARKINPE